MSKTMQQALAAKAAMQDTLRSAGVAASCGVTKNGADFAVKVNVSSRECADQVPERILDVPVVVAVTGPVRAMAPRGSGLAG